MYDEFWVFNYHWMIWILRFNIPPPLWKILQITTVTGNIYWHYSSLLRFSISIWQFWFFFVILLLNVHNFFAKMVQIKHFGLLKSNTNICPVLIPLRIPRKFKYICVFFRNHPVIMVRIFPFRMIFNILKHDVFNRYRFFTIKEFD